MLQPKKTKFRKQQRGVMKGQSKGAKKLDFGSFGIRALESVWITSQQIEAARKVISRATKKGGKVWIRIFPDKPVTSKGVETGALGGGKGDVDHWVAVVKTGRILFEIDGVSESLARDILRKAGNKLPIKTKFVSR